jgi:hypothetical protein
MASSCLRIYGNLPAKAANSLLQAVASVHLPAHPENVLRCWPQAAWPATGNLRVPRVPRSQNRESHSFPIQVLYWLCSKAWLQLEHAWCYARALLHLDQRDALAIHQASIEARLSHFQAFEQALFFLNREAQPSNEELPHLILPKFTYEPPNVQRVSCAPVPSSVCAQPGRVSWTRLLSGPQLGRHETLRLPSRLIAQRHRPRAELQPAHELQVDTFR